MNETKKNIIIWSSIIGGGMLVGILIYAGTTGKRKKITTLAEKDKDMKELLDKIEKAPK
jgi:hypothetical protein